MFDTAHNGQSLSPPQRNIMANDFMTLRRHIQWRNLHTDVHSLRNVFLGRAKASLALQALGGGEKKFISVSHELNGNANVVFLLQNMKVPTCVLTVHGRLVWHWSPKGSDGADLVPRGAAPFLTAFFDRTMSLLWDNVNNMWSIQNDMVFMRPDRTLLHDDGSASSPLFFANQPTRVEVMRRRYLPNATTEVMRSVIEHFGSDAGVQAFIMSHLPTLPADRVEGALKDPASMLSLIQG
ncbi:nuclear RNA export factor 1/2 [Trypanosoma rangeli]|uniref:Nuclear RNA export factor 1/2 n=1 Tax=Trypanosoma rangeli TaxID=5698 RepID=A0A3R7K7M6_TRYRA|nr:nuclear RNA export factor 1/2 [Trypanosoma rangeli]RNF03085.1 nuclear RNA export factor 1/2 [Trypanosoma rangeli]|eukprot:RNF03085.1 nuclear RNA export factor 1/2 [Trypanosoma rangeli]